MSYFRPIAMVLIDFIGRLQASATAFWSKLSLRGWNGILGLNRLKNSDFKARSNNHINLQLSLF